MRKVFTSIIFCYAFVMVVDVKAYDSRRLGGTMIPSRRKSASIVPLVDTRKSQTKTDDDDELLSQEEKNSSWHKLWQEDDPAKAKFDKFKVGDGGFPENYDVFYGLIIGVVSPTQMEDIDKDAPSRYVTTYYMVKTYEGAPKVMREDRICGYKPGAKREEGFALVKRGYKSFSGTSRKDKLNLPIFVKMKSGWKRLVNVDKDLTSKYACDEKRRLEEIEKLNKEEQDYELAEIDRIRREKEDADDRAKREKERPFREVYGELEQGYEIALMVVDKRDPERRCMIHKWQEKFAPRYKGDLYTEQSKSDYARNYIDALRAEKDGVLKCECKNPIYVKLYEKAMTDCEEAKKKLDDYKVEHADIDFSDNKVELLKARVGAKSSAPRFSRRYRESGDGSR